MRRAAHASADVRESAWLERLCAEKGLLLTRQRQTICHVLALARDRPDAIEIHRRCRAQSPRISLGSTYRCLRRLVQLGLLVKRVHLGRACYQLAEGGDRSV